MRLDVKFCLRMMLESEQMYKCKGCGKRFVFTSLGGLSNSKLPVEIIIQIIKCMSNDETYKTTCLMLGINKKTAVFSMSLT